MELNEMPIEQLELSVRSTNALRRSKIDVAGDLMALTTEQLYAIRNLGEKSVTEILEKIDDLKSGRFSARSKLTASTKQLSSQKPEASVGNPNEPGHSAGGGDAEMTIFDMIQMTEYRDQILANARKHDFLLEERLYSTRAINRLRGKGYHKISEILFLSHDDLMEIKSLGTKSVQEIEDAVRVYLIENEERLRSDCSGTEPMAENEAADKAVNYDALPQMILNLYQGNEFRGYSLKEMKDALALPEAADDNRIKKAIGSLLADRELEYVDFRCYRIYEPFAEELDRCDQIDDRGKRILHGRLEGKTLESISGEFDLTRERVRQLVNKNARIVSSFHLKRTGKRCFDEDYYRYFYENYAIEKKDAIEWLGIPEPVFRYFDMIGAAGGSKDLNRSMEDHTGLDAGLRMKINNYLNRDKVYVDGVWIRKSRAELERVAVRKLCGEQLSFKEFAKRYNTFLMEQDIDDEDLLITDAVYRTRLNRMADRRNVLCSWSEHLRYYDIDGQDYEELVRELNLNSFENTELSTWKLFHDHPMLMKKYDIRDQYELYSLLKKTVPVGAFHNFQCVGMPYIRFGEFDRDAAILKLIRENSPLRTSDLCMMLQELYGYDPGVVQGSYLATFSGYCSHGVYAVSHKPITAENRDSLRNILDDECYTIDEIRKIYSTVFQNADPEEITADVLREMGFAVLSGFVLRNDSSLEAFFRRKLTGGLLDLNRMKARFQHVGVFCEVFQSMRMGLDLIEFEQDRFLSIEKLKGFGITKDTLHEYCDRVWNSVTEGEYFSIVSLRKKEFESGLDDLVFSDLFYASVLQTDERFLSAGMWGTTIFRRGEERLTIRTFIEDLVKEEGYCDIPELMELMNDGYGCNVVQNTDLLEKITDSDLYYDEATDRLYRNVELYYQELDEAEGKRA